MPTTTSATPCTSRATCSVWAIAAHRRRSNSGPISPRPTTASAFVLYRSGDLPCAIAAYREAIRLQPDYADAHHNLGAALLISGDAPGAIAALRKAIRLQPDEADAHYILGLALFNSDNAPGAVAAFRAAIRLKPNYADAHYHLGIALGYSDNAPGVVAAFRATVRLKPDLAEAHCFLGLGLGDRGEYAEALAELRTGHELGSKRAGWRYPSADWVREAEQMAATAGRLPATPKSGMR